MIDFLKDVGYHPTRVQEAYWSTKYAQEIHKGQLKDIRYTLKNLIENLAHVEVKQKLIELYMKANGISPDKDSEHYKQYFG